MTTPMALFFIGIVEMIIISFWTKVVSDTKVVASGIITVINIFIWYYVLQTVIENITNFWLILIYALGCAIGTMISTYYFNAQKKRRKSKKTIFRKIASKIPSLG